MAKPAEKWPHLFGNIPLFNTYPYLLPCIVSAVISCFGFLVGYVCLEETAAGRGTGKFAQRPLPLKQALQDSLQGPDLLADEIIDDDETKPLLPDPQVKTKVPVEDETDAVRAELSRWESDTTVVDTSLSSCSAPPSTETTPSKITEQRSIFISPVWSVGEPATRAITGYAMLSFQNIIFDEVFSLWTVTSPKDGMCMEYQLSISARCIKTDWAKTLNLQI